MLENVDLSKKLDEEGYRKAKDDLSLHLGELQRKARDAKIPVMVVFEGWGASEKAKVINQLILPLDPRGFKVNIINAGTVRGKYPFLRRYWKKTPARGRIAIFDRSWYSDILDEHIEDKKGSSHRMRDYARIESFERQLADDGMVIIKLFLHISAKEQKKRLEEREKNPDKSWTVDKRDWDENKKYGDYLKLIDETISRTDCNYAPWVIIEAEDRRFAIIKAMNAVADAIEKTLQAEVKVNQILSSSLGSRGDSQFNETILSKVDLSLSMDEQSYKEKIKSLQKEISLIAVELFRKKIPFVIVFEGWDAAGKGGCIKKLTEALDPRGYEVIPVGAPSQMEKDHHYLWRFWNAMPKAGHFRIFDRSWYGRILVERVEGFCKPYEWERAYREINEMEEDLSDSGTIVIKFWLQVDKEEQLKRFESRQSDSSRSWKITQEDWRNREKWDLYVDAVNDMLLKTSTAYAPWVIVESNSKFHARVKVLEKVLDEGRRRL